MSSTTTNAKRRRPPRPEATSRLVRIVEKPLWWFVESSENELFYRPVRPDDPEVVDLARSAREVGQLQPLVTDLDGNIISGHRRIVAFRLAGLKTLKVIIENFRKDDDPDRFISLIPQHNLQRSKTLAEKVNEELLAANPKEAYRRLVDERKARAKVDVAPIIIRGTMSRSDFSAAKQPFMDAILTTLERIKDFLPTTVRGLHYQLLRLVFPLNTNRPGDKYENNKRCYKMLSEIVTRMRIAGLIPLNWILDETRPLTTWNVFQDERPFIRSHFAEFLQGYYRDLLQSQPNHVELLGEKNTVAPIITDVASDYCLPVLIGRGYASLPPRAAMAERFKASGKEKLILLIVADHDPDGCEIGQSFARSMRDDFHIDELHPIKVCLTEEQVKVRNLPPSMDAKASSQNYDKFVELYGTDAFELEAIDPPDLQGILRSSIESVLDMDKFEQERSLEQADAKNLEAIRRAMFAEMKDAMRKLGIDWEGAA